MTSQISPRLFNPFLSKKRKTHIEINIITEDKFKSWIKKQTAGDATVIEQQDFTGKSGQIFIHRNKDNEIKSITAGTSKHITYSDGAKLHDAITSVFSNSTLSKISFHIEHDNERLPIGFGWAAYKFDVYKKEDKNEKTIGLILTNNKKRIQSFVESVCFIRDLVNIPANDMGPDELENAAKMLCKTHDLKLKTIKDEDLLKKNFPMIYNVGRASVRRPRLLDFSWGDTKNPKITLVGKGVCFDTGGLDLKPSQYMITMKKDMGGAAHVLGLAHMIISLKLPIQLRVLIPAVENSIDGNAYRPSDVLPTRKGLSVEIGNTDAEGRLVLADALTYASEDKPEMIIDFATLTGAARIAVGHDLPALFCKSNKVAREIMDNAEKIEIDDPVWQLPLFEGYRKEIDSKVADISSTGGKAGATTAALFLKEFVEKDIEWIHMDCFAWEDRGTVGRPYGGADTGMRAIFSYLEKRFG